MEEEEHEVYGAEIPDLEGDMDPHNAEVDMSAADEDAVKVLLSLWVSILYRDNENPSDCIYLRCFFAKLCT